MIEYTGLYYSEDIIFRETSSLDTGIFNSGDVYYEVLRIHDGTALFLEDHLGRLQESVNLSGHSFNVSVPVVHYVLRNLIAKNNTANGNVRIIIHFREGKAQPVTYTYFVPHFYPSVEMYQNGVSSDLYKAERTDPNVKQIHRDIMVKIHAFINSQGIYDALLVDDNNTVTEGSRTNVFFVKDDSLFTAPADKVLKGITRTKIFELCKNLNINIFEKDIQTTSLSDFETAFFSGTSPKVLPINRIGQLVYKTGHPVVNALMKSYDDLVSEYIRNP